MVSNNQSEQDFLENVERYVGLETQGDVVESEIVDTFDIYDTTDHVASVTTDAGDVREWWVIGGDSPLNLYPKSKFANTDEAFSFHFGLSMRMQERQVLEPRRVSGQYKYHAFICHASDDKEEFVKPLSNSLKEKRLKIWHDDFEMSVGDSLRESINEGLSESAYGIVALSENFFGKEWTERELNGLTARETEGEKIILPIWYQIDKEDILEEYPPLADKIGIKANQENINDVAEQLFEEIIKDI